MTQKFSVEKTAAQWKELLSPEAYKVLRENGTEFSYSGAYDKHFEKGSYCCAACKTKLFESTHKYNSGCGWPAFDASIPGAILYIADHSHGMRREETRCATCNSHLGHLFEDGPTDTTGERYCINSVSLEFIPEKTTK
jgi:peptide-methionine (R)-S-oxide reductase